jgi:hypothetical protein
MTTFSHTLLRTGVWNLAGNNMFAGGSGIEADSRQAWQQVLGLAYLDADFITLVEVFPETTSRGWPRSFEKRRSTTGHDPAPAGQPPEYRLPAQDRDRRSNPAVHPRLRRQRAGRRQALAVDVRAGARFKAVVIGVHLKSGRDGDQELRDTQCRVIGDWITRFMRHRATSSTRSS